MKCDIIKLALIRWARERAGYTQDDLASRFKSLPDWEAGKEKPTLRQVEVFARSVHVPVGYLFLTKPPEESVPIPDFRTVVGRRDRRPSPNLLDTICACQERQSWYRDFARVERQTEIKFIGSATISASPEFVAARMRETLGFDLSARSECPTWTDALRLFIRQTEATGVLAMVNGVVASNTHRSLDPREFRGFALCDPIAPLVFINGADTKAAQMFTLAHELADLWLGGSALSHGEVAPRAGVRREEVWCNAVAAELLVPLTALRRELLDTETLHQTLDRLVRVFKVSSLVILRRLLDAEWLSRERFASEWEKEKARRGSFARKSGAGGNFYRTTLSRVGHRFAQAIIVDTLEGRTLYRDAYRMLGVSRAETFNRLGREARVIR